MKYQIQVNNGNANLGVTQKTITANEVTDVVDQKFMAHYIHLKKEQDVLIRMYGDNGSGDLEG